MVSLNSRLGSYRSCAPAKKRKPYRRKSGASREHLKMGMKGLEIVLGKRQGQGLSLPQSSSVAFAMSLSPSAPPVLKDMSIVLTDLPGARPR